MSVKKNNSKTTEKKTKDRRPSWFIVLSTLPTFAHFVFILILLFALFFVFILSERDYKNSLYQEAARQATMNKQFELKYNVFGDHYVNNYSVNNSLTNFYYNVATTAYMFTPNYNWLEKETCEDKYCGESIADLYFAGALDAEDTEYCLNRICLRTTDNKVYYNDKLVVVPDNINADEIKNISIYPLSSTWLVGFVYQDGAYEKGRAYQFDGDEFADLDPNSETPFVSRKNFEGANFGFGGSDDNYVVLFGGYDFSGYQVVNGESINISKFFNLRVANGGFTPIALKQETGNETIWYVCSLTEGKPHFLKLWQNGSESIKGSLDLTETLLENRENATSAWCQIGNNPEELEVIINSRGIYYKKIFQDNGFEQKQRYTLASKNLLSKRGLIDKAKFEGLIACDDIDCNGEVTERTLDFKTSGDGIIYESAELNETVYFPPDLNGLYYKLEAKGRDGIRHYSPWIDGFTDITYSWWQ